MSVELDAFGRELLRVAMGRCPACGADGRVPCGWWTGKRCFEPDTLVPLHREGQPNVHGCRPLNPGLSVTPCMLDVTVMVVDR